ncbi:MAG: PD-(D/E)XK nuclease family protein, partial [Candidatus Pacebacteria bacterium]|nr:PD-(D/E)XK nuclease family protein [Candidatus Paceibacterota bacterium]
LEDADNLLPEILSYPFWELSRETIWNIAVEAEHSGYPRKQWLGVMRNSKDKKVSQIAQFFDGLAGKAQTETLETVFDIIVGGHQNLVAEEEYDDGDSHLEARLLSDDKGNPIFDNGLGIEYSSPFREYYFSSDKFKNNKTEYLTFLSSLRVFVHALREYKNGEQLKLDDMVEFVDLHEKNKLQITDKSLFTNAGNAVNLMTAHKAKGLEFDTVFVISCQNEVWAKSSRGSKLAFPENLAITPAGDAFDDQLKLFYVAMTRAKSNLYLTSYTTTDSGKKSSKLQFLDVYETEVKNKLVREVLAGEIHESKGPEEMTEVLTHSWEAFHTPPFKGDEKVLLKTLLENYQMPVTHLNNFLDVTRGGPQTFLEQNLLRFPQSMGPAAAYGTSMHKVIELLYTNLRKDGLIPGLEQILEWFEKELLMKRLSDKDYKLFLKRGRDALAVYYRERLDTFDPTHKIEVNFRDQEVVIGDAHITGKIDKMIDAGGGEFEVVDFKTGKAVEKWGGKTLYEKVKLHNYKRQIIFYKLLVENSRDYMQ